MTTEIFETNTPETTVIPPVTVDKAPVGARTVALVQSPG